MVNLLRLIASVSALAALSTAHAALVSLGDGTVKDTATNLIWLQDWNVNGRQDWYAQNRWAEDLVFAGSDDWDLPTIDQFGGLFAQFGRLTLVPEFINVQASGYWSDSVYVPGPQGHWEFVADDGQQLATNESAPLYGVAVRQSAVPEPATLSLVAAALLGLLSVRRRSPR